MADEPRIPPQNLFAERAVLGSVMIDSRKLDDVSSLLKSDYFYSDIHQMCWEAIVWLVNCSSPFDPVTMADRLESLGQLEEIGGMHFLHELLDAVPHAEHATYYANIVRAKYEQRTLLSLCETSIRNLYEQGPISRDEVLAEHELKFNALLDDRPGNQHDRPLDDVIVDSVTVISQRCEQPDRIPGLTSGFADLDTLTNGFCESQLTILAARPSMGKTAFVCNVIDWFCLQGYRTMFFSLEQSSLELAERFLCIRSRLDGHNVKRGRLDPAERFALMTAAAELRNAPVRIDDTTKRTVSEIAAISRRMKRRQGLDAIVIDYLQIIEPEDRKPNRETQVATISRRLKALAKDLRVPVICLAQLSREVDKRPDKRPKLGDLRESGAIEQDADIVSFLHRPGAYDPEQPQDLAEVIVAKHRSGRVGIASLKWIASSMRFQDATPDF